MEYLLGAVMAISILIGLGLVYEWYKGAGGRRLVIGILLMVLGMGSLLIMDHYSTQTTKLQREPFQSHLSQYISTPSSRRTEQGTYVKGKVIPIDKGTNTIDWEFFNTLPENLRPTRPDEVGTILWLQWKMNVVGQYGKSGIFEPAVKRAIQWECDITVIDQSISQVVHEEHFVGERPPDEIREHSGKGPDGGKPFQQISNRLIMLHNTYEFNQKYRK